jgi:hypothetical protein
MSTSQHWIRAIKAACAEIDPAKSNVMITNLHFGLSNDLAELLGSEGGPNFHSWAVWGSRKAGVTIRQEDLDSAIRNATVTAGAVGAFAGAMAGIAARRVVGLRSSGFAGLLGAGIGALAGANAGKSMAAWSRSKASELILAGNQTVLCDIGEQSARFLEMLENGATDEGRATFFAGLREGSTECKGQDRLARAFRSYLEAFDAADIHRKREAMIAGNCEIVYHEHIRLEPYIRGAMPWIVRRCATQRMMSYEVGGREFSVSDGTASLPATKNWVRLEERMSYVFALFREFHDDPEVFASPFATLDV